MGKKKKDIRWIDKKGHIGQNLDIQDHTAAIRRQIIFENYKPRALWNRGRRAGKLYGLIPLEKRMQLIHIHVYQMMTQIMKSHHTILRKKS